MPQRRQVRVDLREQRLAEPVALQQAVSLAGAVDRFVRWPVGLDSRLGLPRPLVRCNRPHCSHMRTLPIPALLLRGDLRWKAATLQRRSPYRRICNLLDRETWRAQWEEGDYPSPPCPTCGAPLNWDEAAVVERTPAHNVELMDVAGIEDAKSRFAGWFVCGHVRCGEAVAVLGKCTYRYGYGDAGKPLRDAGFIRQRCRPSSRRRTKGFPAESPGGKFVPLDKRIDNWSSTYGASGIATSLLAIKWLGNVGAHETEVSRDRLFDAYEILDRVLKQMFPADERDL